MVDFLLKNGARVTMPPGTPAGKTPIGIAEQQVQQNKAEIEKYEAVAKALIGEA
jgi:hypothetical protein